MTATETAREATTGAPVWRRRSGGLLLGAVAAAVAIGVSAGWLSPRRDSTTPAVADDPGVVHVHGLGVNPADGALYAATHTGLFRLDDDGRVERIADRHQDTMGFTIAGPDRFLASGHPDMRDENLRVDGKPPLLGLAGWRPDVAAALPARDVTTQHTGALSQVGVPESHFLQCVVDQGRSSSTCDVVGFSAQSAPLR